MFISRTTREERVTIETALDSAFLKIDQAEQLIYDLIDAFLSDREQKTLDKHDAQTIRNNLWIADDLLADAQLEYHLHAGHGDAPCVQQYLESAARANAVSSAFACSSCATRALFFALPTVTSSCSLRIFCSSRVNSLDALLVSSLT